MTVIGYLEGGAGSIETESGWALVMLLSPWLDGADGEVHAATLRVVLPAERKDAQARMQQFTKGAAVAIDVITVEPPGDVPWWTAKGALPVQPAIPGEALVAFRRRLEQPVVLADLVLGRLTLEREHGWFRGRCHRRGLSCDVTVGRTALEEDREADQRDVDAGREALLRVEARLPEILAAAAADLHGTWDQSWREERSPLSREAFAKHLKVKIIDLSRTRLTLWLDAGDLFDGHEVELRLSPSGELQEICLAG